MTYIPIALRQQVIATANGCCEYCFTNHDDVFVSHEIDHIIPIKHHGETVADNLCYSCAHCNRNKGSDLSSIDLVTKQLTPLYNPRTDLWSEHFRLDGFVIKPLTAVGRVTEFVLDLNSEGQLVRREMLVAIDRYPCLIT